MPRGQLLFKNTLYTASASMLWQVLALLTLPILISSVGIEDFGIFSLAAASLGYFSLMSLPARQAMVKFAAQTADHRGETKKVFNAALLLNIAAGIFVATVLGLLSIFANDLFNISPDNIERTQLLLALYAIAGLVIQPMTIYGSLLRGFQIFKPIALLDSIAAVARVSVILLIYFFDGSIFWYAINEVALELLKSVILRSYVRKYFDYIKVDFRGINSEVVGKIFSYGGWTVIYVLSLLVVTQGSKILIGVMMSVAAITYFHVAIMLYNLVNTVSNMIRSSVLPSGAAAIKAGDHVYVDKLINSGSKISLCILLPVCIQLMVYSEVIIRVWMGEEFVKDASVLSLLMIMSWLFVIPNFLLTHVYWAKNDISALSKLSITCAVLYMPIMMIMVEYYEIHGVGMAFLLFFAVQFPFQLRIIARKIELDIKRYLTEVCFPIYVITGITGIISIYMLKYLFEIEGLFMLLFCFVLTVGVSVVLNFVATSRSDGLFLLNKFQHMLSRT